VTIMPPDEPRSPTYASDRAAVWREIRALWRKVNTGRTIGQLGLCLVQAEEPVDAEIGTFWFDLDEPTV
jgi:hypothetical protein